MGNSNIIDTNYGENTDIDTKHYVISRINKKKLCVSKEKQLFSETRQIKTYVFVVDISGSMGEPAAKIKGNETDGYDRITLVKTSLIMAVNFMKPGDRIIIICFDDSAFVIFNDIFIDVPESNFKNRAISIIKNINYNGGTYLYGGIRKAFTEIEKIDIKPEDVAMVVLTDGQTREDTAFELNNFLSNSDNFHLKEIKITSFGYSSGAESEKLSKFSKIYGFIPDSSMVACYFCNYLANIVGEKSWDYKYIVKEIEDDINEIENKIENIEELNPELQFEIARYETYIFLMEMCFLGKTKRVSEEMREKMRKFLNYLKTAFAQTILLRNIIKDFESEDGEGGQITIAISSNELFAEWGLSYFYSLASALRERICHNFKDFSVSGFITPFIKKLQDEAYEIYSEIPAPQPIQRVIEKLQRETEMIARSKNIYSAPVQCARQDTMRGYTDRSGGCWAPFCKIKLADGRLILLDYLSINDKLWYDGIKHSIIKSIVRFYTQTPEKLVKVCRVENLVLTPNHPIEKDGKYLNPCNITECYEVRLDYVINIVLEDGHEFVIIEGIKTVTIGHNFNKFDETNNIIEHPYFGTNYVIDDIEKFSKDKNGITHIINYEIIRDPITWWVCGIKSV